MIPDHLINISTELQPHFSYSMAQNSVPMLDTITITNQTLESLYDLRVKVSFEPAIVASWEHHIVEIDPKAQFQLHEIPLKTNHEYLMNLEESQMGYCNIEVFQNEIPVGQKHIELEILAYNEWRADTLPQLLAAFVMPNHPVIAEVLSLARKKLEELTGSPALDGYQSGDPQRSAAMAKAVYLAIQSLDITYSNPPASFRAAGQKIRTPEQILAHQMGTCLDLTLFYAACLEQAGLNPTLMMLDGHAFMGVWLEEPPLKVALWDDLAMVSNEVDAGLLLVLDSSTMVFKPDEKFQNAVKAGHKHLTERFLFMLDIRCIREFELVRPLPARAHKDFELVPEANVPNERENSVSRERINAMLEAARKAHARNEAKREREAAIPEVAIARLERWSGALLDISLRNKLINTRMQNIIQFETLDAGLLEDKLAQGTLFQILPDQGSFKGDDPRSAQIYEAQTGNIVTEDLAKQALDDKCLLTKLASDPLEKRLKVMARALRLGLEEGGVHTLYISLGMLSWYESPTASKERMAPLVLIPVELKRKSAREPFRLQMADEDPIFNPTLLEMLKHKFDISITPLLENELPTDHAGLDVDKIFNFVRDAIRGTKRWQIKSMVVLGQFSFNKLVMYRDLTINAHHLLNNNVVKHLTQNARDAFTNAEDFPMESDLDGILKPGELCCPKDADSSQLVAIESARRGMSFVLQGPPGTGKSQTITNLIAALLSEGKTALFVSEKMAALDVVRNRLNQVGLGDFCLELHSNKTKKKDFLNQLGKTLRLGALPVCESWDQTTHDVEQQSEQISDYVDDIHQEQPNGFSLYNGITRLAVLEDRTDISLEYETPAELTSEKLEILTTIAAKLTDAHDEIGNIQDHPFRHSRLTQYSPNLNQEIPALCRDTQVALTNFKLHFDQANQEIWNGNALLGYQEILTQLEVAKLIAASPKPRLSLLKEVDIENAHRQLTSITARGIESDAIEETLLQRWKKPFFELDTEALHEKYKRWGQAFFLIAFFMLWGARKILKTVKLTNKLPKANQILTDLNQAHQRKKLKEQAQKEISEFGAWVGVVPSSDKLRWIRIEAQAKTSLTIRKILREIPVDKSIKDNLLLLTSLEGNEENQSHSQRELLTQLYRSWMDLETTLSELYKTLKIDPLEAYQDESSFLLSLQASLTNWESRPQPLRQITRLRSIELEAHSQGMGKLIDALHGQSILPQHASDSIEKSYHTAWVNHLVSTQPQLSNFSSRERNRSIQKFRKLDQEYIKLSSQESAYSVSTRLPKSGGKLGEMGTLARELQKKRSHMPIRKLFKQMPTLIRRLKPCHLMSPLSVAQYLDPSLSGFDVVIFDEASQIPVPEAIGAIARGKQLIVVGDTKQMPPTNMFGRANKDEETAPVSDDIVEELESILDECIAAQLPEISLKWHYRSKHESLITFSNFHYYDSNLFTFPSTSDSQELMGVSHVAVTDGIYDWGKTRTNIVEARALVADVVRRLRDPVERTRSIGIVTFNVPQMSVIEDLLDDERKKHPEIEPYFSNAVEEKVFIKNLENVQGDERDVILFSVCYGPNNQGKVSMNFGPLNKVGGERRLNVAITRAKQQLIVYSTLKADQIDPKRTQARGALHLKHFLSYACHGVNIMGEARASAPRQSTESVEYVIKSMLTQKGWQLDSQVGNSQYRIDLAVKDPNQNGSYIAGIECDGQYYYTASTTRDRDRLRSSVLTGLGWDLIRIWSLDFFLDPIGTINNVDRELKQLAKIAQKKRAIVGGVNNAIHKPTLEENKHQEAPKENPNIEFGIKDAKPEDLSSLQKYQCASQPPYSGTDENFYEAQYTKKLVQLVEHIAHTESPIHKKRVTRAAMEQFSLNRTTNRVTERVNTVIALANVYVDHEFIWTSQEQQNSWSTFRVPDGTDLTERKIEEIDIQELAYGCLHLLDINLGLDEKQLIKETAKLFGTKRVNDSVEKRISEAIQILLNQNKAVQSENQIMVT